MKIKTSTKINMPSAIKKLTPSVFDIRESEEQQRITLMKLIAEASSTHPYTFATVDTISRSIVGAGWKFLPKEGMEEQATDESLAPLKSFFHNELRDWTHINDFISSSDRLTQMINSYKLFGHTGLEIVRSKNGTPVGYDVLSGILFPNLKENGYFKTPNFTLYPWADGDKVDFDAKDVIYIWNPGILGHVGGESAYESLTTTTLPSDLYAAVAFRELFKNTNAPYNGVWELDPNVSDDDFDYFVQLLEERYSGAENYGRNPLVVRGSVNWREISSRSEEDAPYLEGRNFSREEFYAATGVDGNKLGNSGSSNKSNIRETRREFHENTIRPLVNKIEENLYYQVMVRLFNTPQWELKFTRTDLTTAMEQAAIDMRQLQWGVASINEIRVARGMKARDGGDIYFLPTNMAQVDDSGNFIGPEDGGDDNPDDGDGNSSDDTRPPRDDENPDSTKIIKELKIWRRYHLRMMDGKRDKRDFECKYISEEMAEIISVALKDAGDNFDQIKMVFDLAEETFNE